MSSLGDRRASVRLEVFGELWGTLELTEVARVVDISRAGALVVSPVAMAPDSLSMVKLSFAGQELTLEARVRHFRLIPGVEEEPASYLIGLEFPAIPPVLAEVLG